jgi:HTH-type transcriptional regulator/antitoxin HigA
MKTQKKFEIADSYLKLIHEFPLRPIRSDEEYDAAAAIAQKLYLRDENALDQGEIDYLDALDEFLIKYDEENCDFGEDAGTPLERLQYVLEQSETTPKKLQAILGCSQPLVSMILSGDRELSKENIKALAAHFKLSADFFL